MEFLWEIRTIADPKRLKLKSLNNPNRRNIHLRITDLPTKRKDVLSRFQEGEDAMTEA